MRRSELAGIEVGDVDRDRRTINIAGKGGRWRNVPYGNKASRDLDRYMRMRARHAQATYESKLWLGRFSAMTPDGIYQVLERRAAQAGVDNARTHLWRSAATHYMLADGMQKGAIERVMGWKSPAMIRRYAAGLAQERVIAAHREHAPGDRFR